MKIVKSGKRRKIGELVSGILRYNLGSRFGELKPRSLMVNLTYKCNSRCVMCNIWQMKPKNELGLKEWRKVMEDEIFGDIRNLTISGGEIFLYQELVETVKLFIESMPKLRRLVLNTNGFLPRVIEGKVIKIAEYCQKKKIKLAVNISIDGVGEVHGKLRRVEKAFEKAFETWRLINKISKRYEISLGISSLLLRQNVAHFEEMKEWMKKNKMKGNFQIVGFLEGFLNNYQSKKSLDINEKIKKDFLGVLENIRDEQKGWGIMKYYWEDMIAMYRDNKDRTTPCPFLKDDFVIDSLGDVYYCLSVRPIGNFMKEKRTVGEIYFDKKNISFRKKLPFGACRKCNSACNVANSLAFDTKRYIWYRVSGQLWPGKNI